MVDMRIMHDFKKFNVWQKARVFTKEIYSISKSFPDDEKFGITNQVRRQQFLFQTILQKVQAETLKRSSNNFYILLTVQRLKLKIC